MCVCCCTASGYLRLLDLKALESSDFSGVNFVHVDVKVLGELVLTDAAKKAKKTKTHFNLHSSMTAFSEIRPIYPFSRCCLCVSKSCVTSVQECFVEICVFTANQRAAGETHHTLALGLTSLRFFKISRDM